MTVQGDSLTSTPDSLDSLQRVLDVLRSGGTWTRPDLSRRLDLGRTVVAQRLAHLLACGLVEEGAFAPSTGGRPARALRFRATAGQLLVADVGATSLSVATADLSGGLADVHQEDCEVMAGPDAVLARVEQLFDELLKGQPDTAPPVWGIGIGLPGPVEFAEGTPISPPIMPGWDRYPARDRLATRYQIPAWADNDVNILALGETRFGAGRDHQDAVVIKIGSGIGCGLISRGRLHRGAQGAAGDIGHIAVTDEPSARCRCGNTGCLEAVAGGAALASRVTDAARTGASALLARRLDERGELTAEDLVDAVAHGDLVAVKILTRSAQQVGHVLATLVNLFNPSIAVIGGGVANAGDQYLATIRHSVYARSLPLATRNLQIVPSSLGERAGLHGAAAMVADELFAPQRLRRWIGRGTPVGIPELSRFHGGVGQR